MLRILFEHKYEYAMWIMTAAGVTFIIYFLVLTIKRAMCPTKAKGVCIAGYFQNTGKYARYLCDYTAKLPDGRYTIYSVVYSSQEYFGGKLHLKIPTTGHKARLRVKIVNDKIVRVWSPLDSRRRRWVFITALLFLYSAFLIARTQFGLWQ
jgi:hypothetical protein